jgi:hypothetical protein
MTTSPVVETRPASIMGPAARRIFVLGVLLALVGACLSIAIPVLDLRSDACGVVSCGLVQVIGKALASGGLGLALGTVAVASLRAGRFSAAALAALVAGPALLWSVMILDDWRNLQAGTDEASAILTAARDYAAAQRGLPAADLRPIIVNGRGDWVSVRVAEVGRGSELVLLRKDGGTWRPQAIAPSFSLQQLHDMGAPLDVTKTES